MQEKTLEGLKKSVEYLVTKFEKEDCLPITEKVITEVLSIAEILSENKECINREEYHKMEINEQETRKKIKKTDQYKRIIKKKQVKGLEIEKAVNNTKTDICLISQKEITDRIEAPCGHAFDRESLLFFYNKTKRNKTFICPHLGCNQNWGSIGFKPPTK